jgi:hypothetical protein
MSNYIKITTFRNRSYMLSTRGNKYWFLIIIKIKTDSLTKSLREIGVSEPLFSGGLGAVLRGVEPPEIITCRHARAARFIVGRDRLDRNLFSIPCSLI